MASEYPRDVVWYIEARRWGYPENDPQMGTAVAVWLKETKTGQLRKFLLTAAHILREPEWGPLLGEILCFQPLRGYFPRREMKTRRSGESVGAWPARISSISPLRDEVPAEERRAALDWALLEVKEPSFQDSAVVYDWAEAAESELLDIAGYPGGALAWSPNQIVQCDVQRGFGANRAPLEAGTLRLSGPGSTAPGMSGGAVFDARGHLVGIHRAQTALALQFEAVSGSAIRNELYARRWEVVATSRSSAGMTIDSREGASEEPVAPTERQVSFGTHSHESEGPTLLVCYGAEDRAQVAAFRRAAGRQREAELTPAWCEAEVRPGEPWAPSIGDQFHRARVVVALVSPALLAAPGCLKELASTFALRDRSTADVVPVILRPCDWQSTPLGEIQALPRGGAPISSRPDTDAAWDEVVDAVAQILLGRERVQPAFPSRQGFIKHCSDVLAASQRLMLLAPWRSGLEELAQEIARRSHGDEVTTLRLPALQDIEKAQFYAEVSGEPDVCSQVTFREWLIRRSSGGRRAARHLVVLPYFGGSRGLVKELGHVARGVFDELGTFSLLVVGLARCAALLRDVEDFSLFSGIMTEHVPGLDLDETRTVLDRWGADVVHSARVQHAAGGHPEWTALSARSVREGSLSMLDQHLADARIFGVLQERLTVRERDRQGNAHAARTLERLLEGERIARLSDARDDLGYPEVRLYYDGVLVERAKKTEFRCNAARIASVRALEVWAQQR